MEKKLFTVDDVGPTIPFGDMKEFYQKCVFGNDPIPSEFHDDYIGTVKFHKALKNYFGDLKNTNSLPYFRGIATFIQNDPRSFIYWNGQELMSMSNGTNISLSFNFINDGRYFLVKEDDHCYHFIAELANNKPVINRDFVFTQDLPKNKKFKLFYKKVYDDVLKDDTYVLGIDHNVKGSNIISFFIPKERPDKIGENEPYIYLESIDSVIETLEEYNNTIPVVCIYKGSVLFMTYGLNLEAFRGMSKELFDSLNINFDKEYTKFELSSLGINTFLTGIHK